MQYHEDYLLYTKEVTLVEGVKAYDIPPRAVGNKLRNIQYKDSNGNFYEMSRIGLDDLVAYQESTTNNRASIFYIQNNQVVLTSNITSGTTGVLVMYFYIRPSELVESSKVGVITGINTVTGDVTISSVPDDFSTSLTYDFYMVKSPHRPLNIDLTATSINTVTKTLTFDPDDLPSNLSVGDHLSQAGQTNIPQIPSDLHALLAQKVAERVLESQGDLQALGQARIKSQQMEMGAGNIIDNRVEDAPLKLNNRKGLLRQGLTGRKFNRRN